MAKQTVEYIYILGDGDKIRERVESLLLKSDFSNLAKLSQGLKDAIDKMKSNATANMEAEVFMAGGDDIFFRVDRSRYRKSSLEELAESFRTSTGTTFSFGVGTNVEAAYLNLRRAKASGSGQIVEDIPLL